jgi:hypothetical protein
MTVLFRIASWSTRVVTRMLRELHEDMGLQRYLGGRGFIRSTGQE